MYFLTVVEQKIPGYILQLEYYITIVIQACQIQATIILVIDVKLIPFYRNKTKTFYSKKYLKTL